MPIRQSTALTNLIAGAHNKLVRAQDIMTELISALNMDVGDSAEFIPSHLSINF